MAQRTTIAPVSELETTPMVCQHHWVIQSADGPFSNGSCQACGETREFKNYVESATWGDSRVTNKASAADSYVGDQPDPMDEEDED